MKSKLLIKYNNIDIFTSRESFYAQNSSKKSVFAYNNIDSLRLYCTASIAVKKNYEKIYDWKINAEMLPGVIFWGYA
jgi:hypothetical protein